MTGFKLAGIREKVDRRWSIDSTIALTFSTKDSNKAIRSVEGGGEGCKEHLRDTGIRVWRRSTGLSSVGWFLMRGGRSALGKAVVRASLFSVELALLSYFFLEASYGYHILCSWLGGFLHSWNFWLGRPSFYCTQQIGVCQGI